MPAGSPQDLLIRTYKDLHKIMQGPLTGFHQKSSRHLLTRTGPLQDLGPDLHMSNRELQKTPKIVGPVFTKQFIQEKTRFLSRTCFSLDLHKFVQIGWACIKNICVTTCSNFILTTSEYLSKRTHHRSRSKRYHTPCVHSLPVAITS